MLSLKDRTRIITRFKERGPEMFFDPDYTRVIVEELREAYAIKIRKIYSVEMCELRDKLVRGERIPLTLNGKLSGEDVLEVVLDAPVLTRERMELMGAGYVEHQIPGVQVRTYRVESCNLTLCIKIPLLIVDNIGRDDDETVYFMTSKYREMSKQPEFWKHNKRLATVLQRIDYGEALHPDTIHTLSDENVAILIAQGQQVTVGSCPVHCSLEPIISVNDSIIVRRIELDGIGVYVEFAVEPIEYSAGELTLTGDKLVDARTLATEICSKLPPSIRARLDSNDLLAALQWIASDQRE